MRYEDKKSIPVHCEQCNKEYKKIEPQDIKGEEDLRRGICNACNKLICRVMFSLRSKEGLETNENKIQGVVQYFIDQIERINMIKENIELYAHEYENRPEIITKTINGLENNRKIIQDILEESYIKLSNQREIIRLSIYNNLKELNLI